MTNTGQAVLNEYLSLVDERVEDDKNKIRIQQGIHIFKRSLSVIDLFLRCYVYVFIVLCMFFLFFSTEQGGLVALREASDQEIISGIKTFFRLVLTFTIITVVLYYGFRMMFGKSFYFSLKQHRIEQEKQRAYELRHVIDVSEELLRRHKLIQPESNA